MDIASLQADEQFGYAVRARDETLAKMDHAVQRLRLESQKLADGNRHQRRKAKVAVSRIDAYEAWMGARVRQVFDGLTKGYEPGFGTFEEVQREASRRLAAIFD
jgi:hypothetical protein